MLAQNIKKARRGKDLTQGQLGQKIGVSHSTIAGYESGNSVPSTDKLLDIAEVTGWSLDKLLGKSENQGSDSRESFVVTDDGILDKEATLIRIVDRQQDMLSKQQDTISMLVSIVGRT